MIVHNYADINFYILFSRLVGLLTVKLTTYTSKSVTYYMTDPS